MFPVFNSSVPQPMQPQPQDPEDDDDDDPTIWTASKCKSVLQFHGNERTMNINPLILTNVQGSPYFKVELFGIKTFSEVVDQIYYKVEHLEPWAVGSRKTAGRSQTGMCGGVRGVSAGGVVSSAYCLMYKLYTLKVTKKQLYALLEHCDSPYIRGVGFLFLRYTLPPQLMWDWFEPYLDDEEEIDIKAGGGKPMTIGEMCRLMLTRLEWFDTRFPRISVVYEKQIRENLEQRSREMDQGWQAPNHQAGFVQNVMQPVDRVSPGGFRGSRDRTPGDREAPREDRDDRDDRSRDRPSKNRSSSRDRESRDRGIEGRETKSKDKRSKSKDRRSRSRDRRSRSKERKSKHRSRSKSRDKRDRSRSREKKKKEKKDKKEKDRSRSRERHHKKHKKERSRERRRSRSKSRSRGRDDDYSKELKKFKEDKEKIKKSRRSRS